MNAPTKEKDTPEVWHISRKQAEEAGIIGHAYTPPSQPNGLMVQIRAIHQSLEQHETNVKNALWDALDPKLRNALQETARDLAEAEQALHGARAQLADLDQRQPSKPVDVPKWAQKRGEVAGMISAYESVVYGARQAYERASAALAAAAEPIMARQVQQAIKDDEEAERAYVQRMEAARRDRNEARQRRDTIGQLFQKIHSGDVDIFR